MNFNIISSTLSGFNLDTGDEIAVFDGSICCGVLVLDQPIIFGSPTTYKVLKASKQDPGEANGYTDGHTISYKFWDSSNSLEISGISATYLNPITQAIVPAPTFSETSAVVKLSTSAPIARAGNDQAMNEGSLITLDGSESSDPDGSPVTYLWTPPAGITLNSNTAQKPTFTAPEVSANTNYTFSLVVSDGTLSSTADQVVVTVKQVNKSPVAHAGTDQSINEGTVVTLDGSASSDPDGTAVTYLWTAPAGITLSSNTAQKPTFTAPEVAANTNYTFSLVVSDGIVSSTADQVIITVKQVNKAPIANAGADQSPNEGTSVTLDGSASSDPDGATVTYLWTPPAGITLSSNTAQKPIFIAPEVSANTNFTFSLVVNDGIVSSTADQVVVTVKQVNKSPVAHAGTDQSINEGTVVTLDGSASSDPDGTAVTYLWSAPAGITLNSNTVQKPTFTAPEVAANTNYIFSLVVSDGIVSSTADQVIITVKQVNKAPKANAGPDQSPNEETTVTLDGSASYDPEGSSITYLWTPPAGITLSSNTAQKPTFLAPDVSVNTNYIFSLVVNDGVLVSTEDQVIVTIKQVNKIPVANAGTDQSVNENSLFTLDGSGSHDDDSDAITYLWTPPAGITLSSNTVQKPTFTAPEVTANTPYIFNLVVNDGKGNSIADQVVITVIQVNKAPTANAGADQQQNEGTLVTLDASGSSDHEGSVLSYLWTPPAGIILSSNTAQKPTFIAPEVMTNTSYTFSVLVNDGNLSSPADQVTVVVKQVNKAPTANAGIDQSVNETNLYTLDGSASFDPDNDILSYLWTPPAGITLSSNTAQKPTFTAPEVAVNTTFTFTLVVSDGLQSSPVDQVIITVKQGNKTPVANAGNDQTVNEGALVTLSGVTSYDPDADPLIFTWTMPNGLTLNYATTSTPTFIAPEVTSDTNLIISLTVNDGSSTSSVDQVVILVKQVNKAPTANAGIDQIRDEGTLVTLDGSASIDPEGSNITYLWSPPAGITLSSNTDSKPTFIVPEVSSDTHYTFYLTVNDGTLSSVSDQVVITAKQVNKIPLANAGVDQSVNENTLFTLDASGSYDPDGASVTYLWTAPQGIILNSSTVQKPTFIAPEVTANTNYTFTLVVNDGLQSSLTDFITVTVKQVNKQPISNAGENIESIERKLIQLDGSLSSDPDNDLLTYQWQAPSGINLSSTTAQKPSFTAPNVSITTSYTFSLTVNDGTVNSTEDQVIVTILPNKAPKANAGQDITATQNQIVYLNGLLSSDPENDPLTYSWTAPSGIILLNSTTSNPTFSAPIVSTDTNFSIKLKVNDGELDSPEDEIIVTVLQKKAPIANAGSDISSGEGLIVSLDGSGSSDPNGGTITYLWTAPEGITLSSNTSPQPSFTAPEVLQDTPYTFSLIVNNGFSNSSADQVTITIKQVNKAPVANAGNDHSPYEGTLVTLDGSQSYDLDNDALTFLWTAPSGIVLSSTSAKKPTFVTPNVNSETKLIFTLNVTDGKLTSAPDEVIITVRNVNAQPLANAGIDKQADEGTLVLLDGSGSSDPDNNVLTFKWTAPEGIILSNATSAKPSFTAPEIQADKTYAFTLVVSDGEIDSYSDEVIITVKQVNKAPVANAGKDQSVNENSTYTLDGTASFDSDGDLLTYNWIAPSGISLNSATVSKPSFITPDVLTNTNYTFTLVVNDGKLNSVADQVTITVKQSNKAPTVNAGPDQSVNEASLVMLDARASADPDGDALVYQWTAPSGIILSSASTAQPTFTAPEVQNDTPFVFSLVVNDGTVISQADQVIITVKQVNKAPVYASAKTFKANEDELFEFILDGSDVDNNPITFLIENLPSFLTLTKKSNTSASLSGKFTNQYVGNNSFKLTLTDGSLSVTESITIVVTNTDDAPYVKDSIDPVSVDKRAPNKIIDLKNVFADDDISDQLTYSITSNTNEKVVTTSISNSSLILRFSTENTGISEITVSASVNGKTAISKFKVEVKIPVGIEPVIDDMEIQVYPNPAKENVFIKFKEAPKTGTKLKLYNSQGKSVYQKRTNNQEEVVNVEYLSPGLYFLQIGESKTKIYKILIE
ncbi:MAG: T9SS type A sorting domain-containing protein [Prolixibacteraceae bacterium]|nr:T9SS type A sorting domain-containing protein [Prolixibacteraceae bacterium]